MILIGADMVPSEASRQAFFEGDTEKLFGKELSAFFSAAEFLIANLEIPLI